MISTVEIVFLEKARGVAEPEHSMLRPGRGVGDANALGGGCIYRDDQEYRAGCCQDDAQSPRMSFAEKHHVPPRG